ncbi:putative amino acid racemase [Halanaerobium saccharolyticum]|uniref:Putative amino acid racemase n=1 Tax=Halanaerobium saccharolyticum TaxID=43595 RepID=A0A4R7ZBM0_9FIRM|nr:alanine/ornithine racemase family PLP-dependent enzyme [Halanaerobium saccharolyticum]RAK11885.1 putative amino acid racemase [Halanaerobium saccharolyticum]TDW07726.1 putative amino acid racemase [Halanaerobium saccharolyticum]TDX64647.1 putative amino acid racemase [Halanaerobium saccharolyticum]
MSFPQLDIYLNNISENAKKLRQELELENIKLTAVVKGFAGDLRIFKAYQESGIQSIADSRIENIKKFREAGYRDEVLMLRIPMLSEIKEIVPYIDASLVTEAKTAELISKAAEAAAKVIDLIIMVDIGDRREGILADNLEGLAQKIESLPGVRLKGIGTNLGCFAGIIPDQKNTQHLINLKKKLEAKLGRELEILSAGNTATIRLLKDQQLAREISNLRVGEAILLGTDIINQSLIDDYHHYNFRLQAEIVELKEKPSNPEGEMAFEGQGRGQIIEDKGLRRRAILAVGKQDIDYHGLYPELEGVEVLGASSDHLITDVTDAAGDLEVGDILTFKINYSAMLRAMTSQYVTKNYIE